jgi:hypothetical protein
MGLPIGSDCPAGLLCRGNQCISQPCSNSSHCDSIASYCIDGYCAESCLFDMDCPGFGKDETINYCVNGTCLACRSDSDCGFESPICDSGTCRECLSHGECSSGLCDLDSGVCVVESSVAYVAAAGSPSSACTSASPCNLARAMSVVDSTRNYIRIQGGIHAAVDLKKFGSYVLSVFGPGTISGQIDVEQGTLKLRDLVFLNPFMRCMPTTVGAALPELDLDRVHVSIDEETASACSQCCAIQTGPCSLRVRRTDFALHSTAPCALDLTAEIAGVGGATADRLSTLYMDQTRIHGGFVAIAAFGANVTVTNSIISDQTAPNNGVFAFGSRTGVSSISFTTIYRSRLRCADGAVFLVGRNNIIVNEGESDSVGGTACVHYHSLIKPQATAPQGGQNLLGLDPRFVDASGGDFHLVTGSPAIDAADPSLGIPLDFDGNPRPQLGGWDMGAFEYQP